MNDFLEGCLVEGLDRDTRLVQRLCIYTPFTWKQYRYHYLLYRLADDYWESGNDIFGVDVGGGDSSHLPHDHLIG